MKLGPSTPTPLLSISETDTSTSKEVDKNSILSSKVPDSPQEPKWVWNLFQCDFYLEKPKEMWGIEEYFKISNIGNVVTSQI